MQFGTGSDYFMPMDREYGVDRPKNNSTNDVGVRIGDIGISAGLGPIPNIPAIGAKMRAGMKTMELTFMGAGKGSGQAHTPEYYGKLQRQALREMQKANEYNFTTHASVNIMGLAGMDQQGNFSKQNQNFALNEIKRAIEFAADVGQGGPVVVHSGEFQRPIVEADNKFQMFADEEKQATFQVVDNRTGRIIQEARKNKNVSRPIWMKYDKNYGGDIWKENNGKSYVSSDGTIVKEGDFIDYLGNKVNRANRVPLYNKKKQHFETRQMNWEDLENEAKDMTKELKKEYQKYLDNNKSIDELNESIWSDKILKAEKLGLSPDDLKVKAEEAYIIAALETQAANSKGFAFYYGGEFDKLVNNLRRLKKAEKYYEELENSADPEKYNKMKEYMRDELDDIIPDEQKKDEAQFMSEHVRDAIRRIKRNMSHSQEGAASQWSQAEEAIETIRHVQSSQTYALDQSYNSYAQAGIAAMKQSQRLEEEGNLVKPVAVAMENLFPESYGAHPDELKNLVEKSRERMAQMLHNNNKISLNEARKKAEKHIYATFDTGHLNMWRKYWKGDENKSIQENDKDFEKWALKKVENLAKSNIIGHLHLVDNYGYQDDHLAPGEGNTPIKKMVEILKKNGFKGEMIVEPGADYSTDTSGFQSVSKTWKLFGSEVYGVSGGSTPSGRNWGDVNYGWFGQNQPPYFSFPPYTPSEEWSFWSGVPLE